MSVFPCYMESMKFDRKRLFDLIGFGVVSVWLVMMGMLVEKFYFQPEPEAER